MSHLRDVYDHPGVEREMRLVERRRLDRQERLQWWIAILLAAWLLTQAATLAAVAIAFDFARIDHRPGWGFYSTDFDLGGPLARFTGAVAVAFSLTTFTVAAILGVIALGNRKALPATWFVAGVLPWLILIVETAVVAMIVVGDYV